MTPALHLRDRSMLEWRQAALQTNTSPEHLAFNNAPEILSLVCTFTAIGFLSGLLRLYIRVKIHIVGSDDYVMAGTMALALGVIICFVQQTYNGVGRHADTITPPELKTLSLLIFCQSLLIVTALSCVKFSVGLFLMRLTTKASRYRTFIKGALVFTLIFWLTCMFTLIFQCIPTRAAWDTSIKDAKCYSNTVFTNIGIFNSSINIATDVLFATIPIPLIWKLQLNTRTKISLVTVLGLGYIASAAAIVKTIKQATFFQEKDWAVHDSYNVWNVIELSLGILATNLPCLKPLSAWFLDAARAISSNSGRTHNRRIAHTGYHVSALGYMKHPSSSRAEGSIALRSLSDERDKKSPYGNVHTAIEGGASGASNGSSQGKSIGWENDEAKRSDESILIVGGMIPPRGIVRTTEVHISR